MSSFSVNQGGTTVKISSNAAGFFQESPYRYYLNNANISRRSDEYLISFGDGSSVRLTDFSEIPYPAGGSDPLESVIGIPAAAEGSFANSFNIIGGYFLPGTFDIYDNVSGSLLLDDYRPQTISGGYFQPYAQFGYSGGSLTVQAPRSAGFSGLFERAEIGSAGTGRFTVPVVTYVGGAGGTAVNQYSSGGGATPWIFALTSAAPAICFAKGTLIMLGNGTELPIERLLAGNLVATSKGTLPIKWIGRRTVQRLNTPAKKYEESLPVRIAVGSLGENIPHLDLLVSDSHGICVDAKITNACYLINGLNIYKDDPSLYPNEISYFHLEFDEEVLVLVNGVQACSYVNIGNRRSFDNYPEFISLYTSADVSVKSYISKSPRNQPSLQGHKMRVKRSWQAA